MTLGLHGREFMVAMQFSIHNERTFLSQRTLLSHFSQKDPATQLAEKEAAKET